MSAVITPHFRRRNAQRVYEAAQAGTDRYYIGLGKNDPWVDDNDPNMYVVPTGSDLQVQEALLNLIALKRVDLQDSNGDTNGTDNNISFVVPNVKWTSGGVYKSWDPSDTNSFYADTSGNPAYATYNNALFICAKSPGGNGASTIAPTGAVGTIVSQADGYSWVKIQESTGIAIHPLLTKSYYPILSITNAPTNSSGKIVRVDIVGTGGGGAGLTTGTGTYTVSIIGNGTGGTASVAVSADGIITSVTVTNAGQNYTFGTVDLSGIVISNAVNYRAPVLRVICAPKNGFASDPVNQLPTWFLGFTSSFDGDEGGQFLIDNGTDYRQISLIKNPSFNNDSQGLNTTALLKIKFTSAGANPVSGNIIQVFASDGITKLGKAFVDYVDVVNSEKFIYVHQNYSTNVDLGTITGATNTFKIYDPVTRLPGNILYTFAANGVTQPEYLKGSGEVIFLENRGPIKRSSLQVESIKVILQF